MVGMVLHKERLNLGSNGLTRDETCRGMVRIAQTVQTWPKSLPKYCMATECLKRYSNKF